jgi:hypothetical protein
VNVGVVRFVAQALFSASRDGWVSDVIEDRPLSA